nr:hypothetical protein [Tanacetum cinerariifolium]
MQSFIALGLLPCLINQSDAQGSPAYHSLASELVRLLEAANHKEKYDAPFHNKKVFANMKRIVADEAVYKKGDDILGKATTTASSLEAEQKVLDLEYELKMTKTSQQTKIESLERRVKKLKKKNMSRTHKLKRLYKVGLTARVEESSDDDVLDKEDASKQGRIETIDADEDISLVSTHKENVSSMHIDDMVEDVIKEEVVKDIITAKLIAEVVSTAATKTVKTTQAPKVRGISIQEQEVSTTRTLSSQQQLVVEGKKEKKYREGSEKRAGEELMSEQSKKQKVSDDKDNAKLYKLIEIILEVEEVAIDVVPLAIKTPIVSWKIVKEGKMSYYQIFRAGGKSQRYLLYMLVEKKYPLTTPTLTMMLDKTLKADHLNEMACKLLKFTLKQIPGAYEAFKKEASKDE